MDEAQSTSGTDRAREAFLTVLRESCNVSKSARVAGIPRRTAYNWRDTDPAFAALWKDAVEEAGDRLEEIAWERAEQGSDRILEVLLKGHKPEKYVPQLRVDNTSSDGSMSPKGLDVSKLSTGALREVLAAMGATDEGGE